MGNTLVTNKFKSKWGSQFNDRKDSFDDSAEIEGFIELCRCDDRLLNHLKKIIGCDCELSYVPHPFGDYDVDLGIYDLNGNILMTIDLERWSAWDNDFPQYYRYLSFLERKEKFLRQETPFAMVWLNKSKEKYIIVEKNVINQYKPVVKYFKNSNVSDYIRQIDLSDGYIFGKNITKRENQIFN